MKKFRKRSKSMVIKLWSACFICLSVLGASATTHYLVPTNNTVGAINPYDSWGTAGTSLATVVNAAMTNGTTPCMVWVTNGIYILTNSISITNALTVKSVNGQNTVLFNGNAQYRLAM